MAARRAAVRATTARCIRGNRMRPRLFASAASSIPRSFPAPYPNWRTVRPRLEVLGKVQCKSYAKDYGVISRGGLDGRVNLCAGIRTDGQAHRADPTRRGVWGGGVEPISSSRTGGGRH